MDINIYRFKSSIESEKTKKEVDELDALGWCKKFIKSMYDVYNEWETEGKQVFDNNKRLAVEIFDSLIPLEVSFRKYPILVPDPTIEDLILDTKPNFKDIKVPYTSFFLNKKFKTPKGEIKGIQICDMQKYFFESLDGTMPEHEVRAIAKEQYGFENIEEHLTKFGYSFIYVTNDSISIIPTSIEEALDLEKWVPKDEAVAIRLALKYAANISNLLTTQVDMKWPVNPKRDVRLIPKYETTNKKERKKSNVSVIRVFGSMKQYAKAYEKEKRKYDKKEQKTVIVKGHWRYLQSPRYTVKRGEHIWIWPYTKGTEELHSRLIKVKL